MHILLLTSVVLVPLVRLVCHSSIVKPRLLRKSLFLQKKGCYIREKGLFRES